MNVYNRICTRCNKEFYCLGRTYSDCPNGTQCYCPDCCDDSVLKNHIKICPKSFSKEKLVPMLVADEL